MPKYAISLALVLLLLVGCGQQSPQETLTAELQAVKSNAAIVEMVVRNLARGAVPQEYAKGAIESSKTSLESSIEALSQLPQVSNPANQDDSLLPHLEAIKRDTDSLLDVVKSGDRAKLTGLADQLAGEQEAVDKIAKDMGIEQ
ncbi:MAG: hypothetical protein QOH93_982 [Chloroflexia bacterium]|jgi:hypothetical protein|nr:hypothetical protein [Chloroflexia bacterium]